MFLASDQKTFSKSWTYLNTCICEQSVPIKLTELIRWCEVLFTIAKLACSTIGTLIAFVYFSTVSTNISVSTTKELMGAKLSPVLVMSVRSVIDQCFGHFG